MSQFFEIQTEFSDQQCLIRALEELGFKGKIEVYQTAQSLHGYRGDVRSQKAHIIIRKQHVGSSSNDIGFERQMDGKYKAHISEYDEARYNKEWLGKLRQAYTVEKCAKEAIRSGYTVQKTKQADGKLRMILLKA